MIFCQASARVAAPAGEVWRVLSDVRAWPTWAPSISAVQGRDGWALEIGASFAIRQPRLRPATWVVTALDPPHRFEWTSRSPGLCVRADHLVQATGPAACDLLLCIRFTGLLAPLAGRLARALTQSYLEQECASLKAAVERGRA